MAHDVTLLPGVYSKYSNSQTHKGAGEDFNWNSGACSEMKNTITQLNHFGLETIHKHPGDSPYHRTSEIHSSSSEDAGGRTDTVLQRRLVGAVLS